VQLRVGVGSPAASQQALAVRSIAGLWKRDAGLESAFRGKRGTLPGPSAAADEGKGATLILVGDRGPPPTQ